MLADCSWDGLWETALKAPAQGFLQFEGSDWMFSVHCLASEKLRSLSVVRAARRSTQRSGLELNSNVEILGTSRSISWHGHLDLRVHRLLPFVLHWDRGHFRTRLDLRVHRLLSFVLHWNRWSFRARLEGHLYIMEFFFLLWRWTFGPEAPGRHQNECVSDKRINLYIKYILYISGWRSVKSHYSVKTVN